jgi:replicative DNA helicase
VAIAQLSREADARGDAKKHRAPVMSDLAESDNLGRDAHWCILIDPEPPPLRENAGVAYLYVRKNRGGKKGECRAKYRPNYSRFLDLDPAAPETQEAGA